MKGRGWRDYSTRVAMESKITAFRRKGPTISQKEWLQLP